MTHGNVVLSKQEYQLKGVFVLVAVVDGGCKLLMMTCFCQGNFQKQILK